ncbi:Biotin synthesis protein BioG [Candidatus Electrothrix laxa]
MKTCWLHQQGNQDCLLFMAGWGMCPEPFQDIPAGDTDVLMAYDYRDMDTGDITSFFRNKTYKRLHLLAWSMGIWTASMLSRNNELFDSRLTTATAIGGTCHPIHDKLGIPEQNFTNMAEQLSPASLEAFQRSMFADEQEANRFTVSFRKGERSSKELHQELLTLSAAYKAHTNYTTYKAQPDVPNIYTSRIVTGRDQIFPARNQVRAWGRKQCRTLSLPHFPFYHWPSWSAMIEELKN